MDGASDLQRRIASGEADPVADAKRAAQLGDFRFVWAVGFGFRAPMGLTCNAIFHPNPGQVLVTRSISDVPDDCERTPDACESQRQLDIYGAAYNRALVNEPEFPAPDVCRPSTPADDRIPKQDAVLRQVTQVRDVRARPHDLHEAARRGSLQEVERRLRSGEPADTLDMFGYTPLAWAVVRDRPEVIEALLKAGAEPYPKSDGRRWPGLTPLWLGIRLGRQDAVRLMLPRSEPHLINGVGEHLLIAAVEGGDQQTLQELISREPSGRRVLLPYEHALRAGRRDLLGVLVTSNSFRPDDLLVAAARVGDLDAAKVAISKGADVQGVGTPLGSVILGRHEADEALLEAFIRAGADVNRITVGNSMSGPPLRIAVKHAYRGLYSRAEDRRTAERQQRIIMRLIEQGARDDTRYPEQAPLAFLAVIGTNARNDPAPNASVAPLPLAVLSALTEAGMDLNETYQGRTVLQWVQSAQPASALVGDLQSLGAH